MTCGGRPKGRAMARSSSSGHWFLPLSLCVGHNPTTGRYYIQPGWGRASWVRNIEAHPFVEAQVARAHLRAHVVVASGPEGGQWLFAFAKQHPLQSLIVGKLIDLRPPNGSEAQIHDWFATNFRIFGLDPIDPAYTEHAAK
jgi:hypothetical protein